MKTLMLFGLLLLVISGFSPDEKNKIIIVPKNDSLIKKPDSVLIGYLRQLKAKKQSTSYPMIKINPGHPKDPMPVADVERPGTKYHLKVIPTPEDSTSNNLNEIQKQENKTE